MPTRAVFIGSVFFLCPLLCLAEDNPSRALSDLPSQAQTTIREAISGSPGVSASQRREQTTAEPWSQLAQPIPNSSGIFFGTSIAVSGSTVVVGRSLGNVGASGAAFVYVKTAATNWNNLLPVAVLTPSDGLDSDAFGTSVAIEGDTIVVGDPPFSGCHDCNPGRSYVYVKPAGGWSGTMTQTAELTASDGISGAYLGSSISISGNTVAVGAPGEGPGAVYVYVEPANGWVNTTQNAKLTALGGLTGDQFGASVSFSDNTVVAGAPNASGISVQTGVAYVYVQLEGGWTNMTQTAKLTASDGVSFDQLGFSVAINGGTVIAGAPRASGLNSNTGAAYVFTEPAGGWKNETQNAKLTAPDGVTGNELGAAVAVLPDIAAAGAPYRQNGPVDLVGYPGGGAYVFTKSGSTWSSTSVQLLTGSDSHNASLFGSAVGINGHLLTIGAPYMQKCFGGAFIFTDF